MKLLDTFISKIGNDKLLHYLIGALLTSWFALFGLVSLIIGVIVVFGASLLKEYKLDDVVDWNDIKAALYGCGTTIIFYIFSLII